ARQANNRTNAASDSTRSSLEILRRLSGAAQLHAAGRRRRLLRVIGPQWRGQDDSAARARRPLAVPEGRYFAARLETPERRSAPEYRISRTRHRRLRGPERARESALLCNRRRHEASTLADFQLARARRFGSGRRYPRPPIF